MRAHRVHGVSATVTPRGGAYCGVPTADKPDIVARCRAERPRLELPILPFQIMWRGSRLPLRSTTPCYTGTCRSLSWVCTFCEEYVSMLRPFRSCHAGTRLSPRPGCTSRPASRRTGTDDRHDVVLEPTGNPTQYEVTAGGQTIGRIALFSALRDHRRPWVWTIDPAFHEGRHPAHGFEATHEAAMQALVKSWNRET